MTSGSSFVLLVFTMLRPREPGGKVPGGPPKARRASTVRARRGGLSGHLRAVTPPDQQRCEPSERLRGLERPEAATPASAPARRRALVLVARVRQGGLDQRPAQPQRPSALLTHGPTPRSLRPRTRARRPGARRPRRRSGPPARGGPGRPRPPPASNPAWSSRRSSSRRLRARTASSPRARSWQLFGRALAVSSRGPGPSADGLSRCRCGLRRLRRPRPRPAPAPARASSSTRSGTTWIGRLLALRAEAR